MQTTLERGLEGKWEEKVKQSEDVTVETHDSISIFLKLFFFFNQTIKHFKRRISKNQVMIFISCLYRQKHTVLSQYF